MTTQEIVSKLWNLCNVLRDDGITYQNYLNELTYILFLKMCSEIPGAEEQIPEQYRWEKLVKKDGIELKDFYKELLDYLGTKTNGRVLEIYAGSQTSIDEPKNLEKIIKSIDALDWFSAKDEGLGDLYEGLLEKNATEKKSGAGQYFTPRVLIDVMTELVKPQLGERCNDPACGTFGFMISAHKYVLDRAREILANYEPKLHFIAEWWKQLYGESEGKDGKGIFPASDIFTTDLHSMGQYIQDGLRNLFETIISVERPTKEIRIPLADNDLDQLNYIAGKRLSEVNLTAETATTLAHVDGGVPNIIIQIPEISASTIGELIYFFEMGCALSGYMLEVNPFDQPGVEAYKKNMFALLGKQGFEERATALRERIK